MQIGLGLSLTSLRPAPSGGGGGGGGLPSNAVTYNGVPVVASGVQVVAS